jgi:hypothetical protein
MDTVFHFYMLYLDLLAKVLLYTLYVLSYTFIYLLPIIMLIIIWAISNE